MKTKSQYMTRKQAESARNQLKKQGIDVKLVNDMLCEPFTGYGVSLPSKHIDVIWKQCEVKWFLNVLKVQKAVLKSLGLPEQCLLKTHGDTNKDK
jgi:hypothetical protein